MKLSLNTTEFVPACEVKIPSIYFNRMRTGIHEVMNLLEVLMKILVVFSAVGFICLPLAQVLVKVPFVCSLQTHFAKTVSNCFCLR